MVKAKEFGRTAHAENLSSLARRRESDQPFQLNQTFYNASVAPRSLPVSRSASPPLVSSQGVPLDHITELFEWMKAQTRWSREIGDLDHLQESLADAGYTIAGISGMKEETWVARGYKPGHWQRVRDDINRWSNQRGGRGR